MHVLIIDDDIDFGETLAANFQDEGITCTFLSDPTLLEGISNSITHVIIDLRIGEKSGLNYLHKFNELPVKPFIILLTAYGSIQTSVEAIKLGADDYLLKPCSFHEILNILENKGKEKLEKFKDGSMLDLYQNEKEYIDYVLLQNKGNISKSAEILGIRRQSLQRKLKKYTEKK
jgi:two-component system response regulator RegA